MECTIVSLLKDGERVVGAFGYEPSTADSSSSPPRPHPRDRGIGRAYKITSNSWEGTGDGHSLAYHAGAELIDMEFIQFQSHRMVWPPSVKASS